MANEKRLIDANAFINFFEKAKRIAEVIPGEMGNILCDLYDEVIEEIKKQPTVDAVEVVRCKDCKAKHEYTPTRWFCGLTGMPIDEDDYCSYGERKDNGQ